ncbi:ABC-type transporter ATP-binding protein EcsA [Arcanobacterium haemolyticum]|uniref:ABC transporter ATP-binding protein n=1 Tax=Arcanobacterium haemolyticum TaxID=28264 RepID=UPI000D8F580B|nr:ABC transporter ATP-binding protein [Arcanobacterium haemolyticum]SPT75989.1 ABC-type transporter ATP-binding protein EcsA [Arcanobacterium haemolyticum]
MNSTPLIRVTNLTKMYQHNAALDNLSLTIERGKIVGLIGKNGSGKTTLLKILAGLLADWNGSVAINGIAPSPETKAHVAFLPSTQFLDQKLTIPEAIALFDRFFPDFDPEKARTLIEFFQLPHDRTIKEMSKGMSEKVQISLVMARKADVYLLDEPISGVDPETRTIILNGILRDFSDDSLLLISTHLVADVEAILDDVVILDNGRLICQANVDDLRTEYGMSLDQICRKGILK